MQRTVAAILMLLLVVGGVVSAVYTGALAAYSQASETSPADGVLLLVIGVHIEPLREYDQRLFFERHVEDIRILARIVERYGGKLTVQAQTPFTLMTAKSGETLLADLEANNHEIGLHFHEDAHLGANPETLSVGTWAGVMAQEISYLKQAGATRVRYWSGGNLYHGVLEAAASVGLDVMSDWKNPHSQQTNALLVGVNPWRPSGGPGESSLVAFAKHDPQGKVVYLPDGHYDPAGFAAKRQMILKGGAQTYFDYMEQSLDRSLAIAQSDRVNVFHITVHPGEFRGNQADPYAIIDQFLADVVNPLVVTGKIEWATFSEMADAFARWEKGHPGVNPRRTATENAALLEQASTARLEKDVTYCIVDGVQLKMDIYYPQTSEASIPALLYVHGGAWTKGDKASGAGSRDISELVKRGYLVAAVNYRLAPEHKFPAQIEDVKCAVRFLRANALRFGLDPERIGAWGGSAGGHLVSLLGVTDSSAGFEGSGEYVDQSSRVQAVVDMFGPSDLTQIFKGANPQLLEQVFDTTDSSSEILKRSSPVTYASRDDPPFLILHGERDTLVPVSQSQELCDRLTAAGVSATLVVVKNAGHGFAPIGGAIKPRRFEITKMMADFFDQNLKQANGMRENALDQPRPVSGESVILYWLAMIGMVGFVVTLVVVAKRRRP